MASYLLPSGTQVVPVYRRRGSVCGCVRACDTSTLQPSFPSLQQKKNKAQKAGGTPGWVETGVGNGAGGRGAGCCPHTAPRSPHTPLPCPALVPVRMLLHGLRPHVKVYHEVVCSWLANSLAPDRSLG